jgi:DNA-binding transcriptional regulator GbsR (MarR family)
MTHRYTQAEQELRELLVQTSTRLGIPPLVAEVHAIIMMEPKEMSLEDITERTGYSLASVSTTVRHLETMRKVRRVTRPGSKKIYVQGEKDTIQAVHDHFKNAVEAMIRPLNESLPGIIKKLKEEVHAQKGKEEQATLKERIAWYERLLEQNRSMDLLFTRIEKEFHALKAGR